VPIGVPVEKPFLVESAEHFLGRRLLTCMQAMDEVGRKERPGNPEGERDQD
jgi:hypothetical protein